jgi:hypothetical protein
MTMQVIVAEICSRELGICPDIVSTKRLGIPQPNKPQPLLVVLRTVDHAQQLIVNAKRWRKSADPEMRRQVFINRNLTRAESEAAPIEYASSAAGQSRCVRRNKPQMHLPVLLDLQ